jgi:hypothetical protein
VALLTALYRREVAGDLNQASVYYAEKDDDGNLVARFLREVDEATARIAEWPNSYPRFDKVTRRALLHHFPFCVYYQVQASSIVVFGILHAKRNPADLRSRIN